MIDVTVHARNNATLRYLRYVTLRYVTLLRYVLCEICSKQQVKFVPFYSLYAKTFFEEFTRTQELNMKCLV